MTEKKGDILNALRDTLRFHQEIGITEYPASEEIQRFLVSARQPGKEVAKQSVADQGDRSLTVGIDTIAEEINACTRCPLSGNTPGRVTGQGKTGSRLMIVGDFSSQSGSYSPQTLFGQEEDEMLWKMMAAIGLQPDQVYVTNALKCCPADPRNIERTCEESCFSFLAREIAAVDPLVICAMGEMAVRVVMGRKDPLARLRGRFGSYRYQSGRNRAVMPTFHPRFLIQQQEMKKATWNDLQLIKRRLDESQN